MDIIIDGTKNGWRDHPFYITNKKSAGLLQDMRTFNSVQSTLGTSAYSLSLTDLGIAFGKYLIIWDVDRAGVGFVAFWVHFTDKKKLSGKNALEFLDTLCEKYCAKYITSDYKLDSTVNEEWDFVEKVKAQYEGVINTFSDYVEFKKGTESPAFLYYKDATELEKYFDDPINDAYSKYTQVLFVDASYKEKTENPLSALKHQKKNLTGQIETGNPQFQLSYSETTIDGVKIDVLVNGSRPYGKSMRKRDILKIDYSKLYHESKSITGNLSSIQDYVGVNDAAKIVTIKEVSLIKKERIIKINITDLKGKTIKGADVRVRYGNTEKIVNDNNEVMFSGDEIGLKWRATVTKADMDEFKDFSPAQTDLVEIKLMRRKRIAVTFQDAADNSPIRNFSLKKGGYRVDIDELEFIDDEIDSLQTFSVSHTNYQSETFKLRPSEVTDGVYVKTLEKVVKLKDGPYRLKMNPRRGSKLRSGDAIPPQISVDPRGNRDYDCKARFGYAFDGWDGPKKNFEGPYFEARFTERWWHKKGFVVTLFATAVITAGVLYFMGRESNQRKPNENDKPDTAPCPQRPKPAATLVAPPSTTDSTQNNDSEIAGTNPEIAEQPVANPEKNSTPDLTKEKSKLPTAKKQGAKSDNFEDSYFNLVRNPNASYDDFKALYNKFDGQEEGDMKMRFLKKITKNKTDFENKWGKIPKQEKVSITDQNKAEELFNKYCNETTN